MLKIAAALKRLGTGVKVLFTSGYSALDVLESAALEQDVPFLHKPWKLADLAVQVREVLGEGRGSQDAPDVAQQGQALDT